MAERKRGHAAAKKPSSEPRSPGAAEIGEALWDAPVGIAVLDRRLRFLRVNQTQAELDHLSAGAHLGRSIGEVVPELPPEILRALEGVAQTGEPRFGLEVQRRGPGLGEERHLQMSFYPLRGARRRVKGVCCITRDVSSRRRTQEAERRAREEAEGRAVLVRRMLRERDESMAVLDALFATAPVGLAVLDRQLRFLRINPALTEISGLPAERHLGRALWEVLPAIAQEGLVRQLTAVMETGQPLLDQIMEGETPAAPGRPCHCLGSWFPVSVAGKVIGVGMLVRDVTEQRQAEEFQRQVLGIVGHDLRSPLLAITASASILQHRQLDDREARAVARILHAASRMEGIIGALADYTQVRIGHGIPLRVVAADLADTCRFVVEEAEAGHSGRIVTCRIEGDLRGEWDAARLGEVLANLVTNALKYGAEGAPVRVECRGEGESVVVAVHNAGPPIAPDFLPQLFQPFRRSAEAKKSGKKGLGLGLFIAREIALAHGGTLEARSNAVEGTVFTLRLPRKAQPPEVAQERESADPKAQREPFEGQQPRKVEERT